MTKRKRFLTEEQINGTLREIARIANKYAVSRFVLIGGTAMAYYGSPRLTVDVDVAASVDILLPDSKPLSFGGRRAITNGVPWDWIVRSDKKSARTLFAAMVENAVHTDDGLYYVATPEYLAAMKLEAGREKDDGDLLWLLRTPKLLDRVVTRAIIERHLGEYAADDFDSRALEADWINQRDGTPENEE